MKTVFWAMLLASAAVVPAMAQEQEAAAEPGVEEPSTAAEAAPTDTTAAEEVVTPGETIDNAGSEAADGAAAASDGGVADEVPAEEAAASDAAAVEEVAADETADSSEPADEGGGLPLYLGVEYVDFKTDVSDGGLEDQLGGDEFDAQMFVIRGGVRLFEVIGLELQGGIGDSASGADELEVKQYFGAFFVPTGTLFELIEVSVRVGYSFMTLESEGGGEEDLDGMSYGIGVDLPIRSFGEGLPNLRFTSGGTIYQSDRESRSFGWHAGLRFDFAI